MIYLTLILTGLGVGFLSSFFGIGGGALIIPVLYSFFPDATPSFVIATSLGTILLTTGLNSYRFMRLGLMPKLQEALSILMATALGSTVATSIISHVDKIQAKNIFAIVLFAMILKILFHKKNSTSNSNDNYSRIKIALTCFIGSLISGITGLGGGIVFVPLLMSYVMVRSKDVSVYSNYAMMITSLTGLIPYFFISSSMELDYLIGSVNPLFILLIFSGAFITSKIGIKYNQKVDDKLKNKILIILLIALGAKIILT